MPLGRHVRGLLLAASLLTLAIVSVPGAQAVTATAFWSCVPYARMVSDVNLSGDAWRWWNAAAGTYARGQTPQPGSVLVFKRTSTLRQGHVAVVRQVINKRRIIVDHANWDRGRRKGRIDESVAILDVSPNNDWSEVRVWYTPVSDFGTSRYPTYGFIYSKSAPATSAPMVSAALTQSDAAAPRAPAVKSMRGVPMPEIKPVVVVPVSVPAGAIPLPVAKPTLAPLSLPKPQVAENVGR